jgi:hypothetical protein
MTSKINNTVIFFSLSNLTNFKKKKINHKGQNKPSGLPLTTSFLNFSAQFGWMRSGGARWITTLFPFYQTVENNILPSFSLLCFLSSLFFLPNTLFDSYINNPGKKDKSNQSH